MYQPDLLVQLPNIAELREGNFSDKPNITFAGYYTPGDGGGGVIYALGPDGGTDDGATVLVDAAGNCFYATSPPQLIKQWGAKCDAVNVRTGLRIAANSNIAHLTQPLPQSAKGNLIVITGAAAAYGTLATAITDISLDGLTLTLRDNALTATPIYVATKVNQVDDGGDDYAVGDIITLNTGDQLIVGRIVNDAPTGPIVSNIFGGVQGAYSYVQTIHTSLPANPATQTATTGNGSGATFTMQYGSTGQFWYGSDDGVAINAALASDENIYFPPNAASMTTIPIFLSTNQTSLLGGDNNSSVIVAGATMDSLIVTPASPFVGGSVRDIHFEAYKLAQSALNVLGGENQIYSNITCWNALNANFRAGVPQSTGIQITQTLFQHLRAIDDFKQFPLVSQAVNYGFYIDQTCTECDFVDYQVKGGITGIEDLSAYNFYSGGLINNAIPYNPNIGIETNGAQQIFGARIVNAKTAAIHLVGGSYVSGLRASFGRTVIQRGVTCGVLIDTNINNVQIYGVNTNGVVADPDAGQLPPDQVIIQLGNPGAQCSIQGNSGASYNVPPVGTRAPQTADFQLTNNAFDWPVDASGGVVTASVPAHGHYAGTAWRVRKIDATGNAVVIDMSGGDTINGAGSINLTTQFDFVEFENVVDMNGNGTTVWTIIGSKIG